jgi:hypothetical protein
VGKVLKRMTQGGTTPRSLPTDGYPDSHNKLSPEISVLGAITSIAMAVGDAIMKEEIDKNKKIFIVADNRASLVL